MMICPSDEGHAALCELLRSDVRAQAAEPPHVLLDVYPDHAVAAWRIGGVVTVARADWSEGLEVWVRYLERSSAAMIGRAAL